MMATTKSQAAREAEYIAKMYRRAGYPDAEPDYMHCVGPEIDEGGFYYYAVSVYRGKGNWRPPYYTWADLWRDAKHLLTRGASAPHTTEE